MNHKIIFFAIIYSTKIFTQPISQKTDDQWRYIYTSIIERPYQSSQNMLACLKRLGKSSFFSTFSCIGSGLLCNSIQADRSSRNICCSITALTTLIISYLIMHEQDKNEEQFKAFASFIAHWPIHKPNTPPELHEILDQVYLQYRFSQDKEIFRTSTKDLLDSVISFLQSKKQQAEAPTSHTQASFWHTIITCDIGNLISSIADVAYKIWKIQHQEKQDNSSWNTYIHIN